ncbi:MAG: ATPase [Bacteroidaceae bacterium]|nr:ATPase [Bacteroidaceae bacterium]
MILIADSGSTKTTWLFLTDDKTQVRVETTGINPVRDSESQIREVIGNLNTLFAGQTAQIHASDCRKLKVFFYGAGCIPPYSKVVEKILMDSFAGASVVVESDLLGAARALCGREEGVACILGTGSNSCLYDGTDIVAQTPALGWILGDEGSGAVLGRRLVGDVLKRQLPEHLCESFWTRFHLSQADIIEQVYRGAQPNRFLASLVSFLADQASEPAIHAFLVEEFRRFLRRNVLAYHRADLPVSFVGGVASQFSSELKEAARSEGLLVGSILRNPVDGMMKYHQAQVSL